jgi:hypothetical protein
LFRSHHVRSVPPGARAATIDLCLRQEGESRNFFLEEKSCSARARIARFEGAFEWPRTLLGI